MTFLAPVFFSFLLTLVPLGLVYLMKTRPRKRVTNALFLWDQVIKENVTQVWLKKVRNFLSLILLVFVFVLACLALTEPKLKNQEMQDLLIILDRSVSMNAYDGARFQSAVSEIKNVLRAIEGGNRVAFATMDKELTYHTHLTHNTQEIKKQLKHIQPSQFSLNPRLLSGLRMVPNDVSGLRILFFTDACSDLSKLPETVEPVIVGEPYENLGLVAGDMDLSPNGTAKLFFTVASSFSEEKEVELEARHVESGRVGKFITLSLASHESKTEVIEIEEAEAGAWELTILHDDPFLEDNSLFLGVNQPSPIAVNLHTENEFFYTRFIRAFQAADNLLQLMDEKNAMVIIAEKEVPPTDKNTLVIHPIKESEFCLEIGDELDSVIPEVLIDEHPILKHLNIDSLAFEGSRSLSAPEGAVVIVREVGGTPLLYSYESEGREIVVVNLDPAKGELYLSSSFPVLLHDAVRYLASREEEVPSVVRVGREVFIPLPEALSQSFYDGESEITLDLSPPYFELNQLGLYKVSDASSSLAIGAGVLSPTESHSFEIDSEDVDVPSGWSIAWYLLLISILFLFVEDALYHRRLVG